jgi:hypothetical protein
MKPYFDILAISADVAGLIGFAISVYLFFNIRKIKEFYIFATRTPELLNALKQSASNISKLNADFEENKNHIGTELARTSGILASLRKKAPFAQKRLISGTVSLVENYNSQAKNNKDVWEIYNSIHKIISHLEEILADSKWEQRS